MALHEVQACYLYSWSGVLLFRFLFIYLFLFYTETCYALFIIHHHHYYHYLSNTSILDTNYNKKLC